MTRGSFLKTAIPTIILDLSPSIVWHSCMQTPSGRLTQHYPSPIQFLLPLTPFWPSESTRNYPTYKTDLGDHSTPARAIFSPCLPSIPFTASSCTHTSHHPRPSRTTLPHSYLKHPYSATTQNPLNSLLGSPFRKAIYRFLLKPKLTPN